MMLPRPGQRSTRHGDQPGKYAWAGRRAFCSGPRQRARSDKVFHRWRRRRLVTALCQLISKKRQRQNWCGFRPACSTRFDDAQSPQVPRDRSPYRRWSARVGIGPLETSGELVGDAARGPRLEPDKCLDRPPLSQSRNLRVVFLRSAESQMGTFSLMSGSLPSRASLCAPAIESIRCLYWPRRTPLPILQA
jgi:hypothetical protein